MIGDERKLFPWQVQAITALVQAMLGKSGKQAAQEAVAAHVAAMHAPSESGLANMFPETATAGGQAGEAGQAGTVG